MLKNPHYLGDDYYPAIIDRETFDKVGGGAPAEGGVPGQDTGTGRTGEKIEVPVSFRAPPGGTEI